MQKGAHDDNIEGTDQHGHDQGGVVVAQPQQVLAHDIGGDQAAAENHGEEAQEAEEAAELVVPPKQRVGVQDADRYAEHRTHDGDQEAVKVAFPQQVAQPEYLPVCVQRPRQREEGIALRGNTAFPGEGNDHHEHKGNDAQQGEQPQNQREEKFCAPADLVEPKMRTGLVLFQGNGRHGSFLLSQNKLLSSSSLRTTALAVMMQMKPTRFCRKPAAVDMPTLRVEV